MAQVIRFTPGIQGGAAPLAPLAHFDPTDRPQYLVAWGIVTGTLVVISTTRARAIALVAAFGILFYTAMIVWSGGPVHLPNVGSGFGPGAGAGRGGGGGSGGSW